MAFPEERRELFYRAYQSEYEYAEEVYNAAVFDAGKYFRTFTEPACKIVGEKSRNRRKRNDSNDKHNYSKQYA